MTNFVPGKIDLGHPVDMFGQYKPLVIPPVMHDEPLKRSSSSAAIDAAFDAQVQRLFATMCSSAAVESGDHAREAFRKGLSIALECRRIAQSVSDEIG